MNKGDVEFQAMTMVTLWGWIGILVAAPSFPVWAIEAYVIFTVFVWLVHGVTNEQNI